MGADRAGTGRYRIDGFSTSRELIDCPRAGSILEGRHKADGSCNSKQVKKGGSGAPPRAEVTEHLSISPSFRRSRRKSTYRTAVPPAILQKSREGDIKSRKSNSEQLARAGGLTRFSLQ